jgi:hypothetical protein
VISRASAGLTWPCREELLNARRFPPPWTVEEQDACFIVRDHGGQALAYVYFEDEAGRKCSASHASPYLIHIKVTAGGHD